MVIAAPPFKRILREREETGAFVRPVDEARGFTAMGRSTMTNRRRRWLRRLAIGISFAVFAAPAAAKPIPGPNSMQIVPLRPDDRADRFTVAQQPSVLVVSVRPDDRSNRFTVGQQAQLASNSVRPDDRADRFAIPAGTAPATSSNAGVSWDGAVTLGLGTLVLVVALGLGIGYARRPRIAGL
jgi:hypothetical protein